MANKANLYPDYSGELVLLDANNGEITPELLIAIIDKHKANKDYALALYGRYRGDNEVIPIFSRTPKFDMTDVNNKVNNDFIGEIIDTKVGYFAGEAANYNYAVDDESEQEVGGGEAAKQIQKQLTDFTIRSNMRDIDAESTKFAAIAGYCGNLLYHDLEGNERITVTLPWETIILAKNEITEPSYAVRYYNVMRDDKEVTKIEFYNAANIYFYKRDGGDVLQDDEVPQAVMPNLYDGCPLIGIPNNRELISDFDKVLAKVDAYDKIISDISNEAEQFVSAYLFFSGVELDEDSAALARKIGAYSTPSQDADGKYLTKNVDIQFMFEQLKNLRQNIYNDSKTPDTTDQTFGAESGIALKYKLRPLENKCIAFETKLTSAKNYMFKLLANSWAKKTISINPLNCFVQFKRNMPIDRLYELQVAAQAQALGLPAEMWLGFLSDVDDVQYIIDLMKQEKEAIMPLGDDVEGAGENEIQQENTGQVFEGSQTNI